MGLSLSAKLSKEPIYIIEQSQSLDRVLCSDLRNTDLGNNPVLGGRWKRHDQLRAFSTNQHIRALYTTEGQV